MYIMLIIVYLRVFVTRSLGKHLRYAYGYRYQGKCDVKTRIQRRREGKKTERRHELGLDRRIRN